MDNIAQMDLLQRKIGEQNYAFVGLIYTETKIRLEEGIGYLLDLENKPHILYTDPILPIPANYSQLSIDGIIKSKNWIPTDKLGYSFVRAIPMGRGDSGYVIYGANRDPLTEPQYNDQIIRVRDGELSSIDQLHDMGGKNLGTILQSAPEWHNLDNKKILVSQLTTPAKKHINDIAIKRIHLQKGMITHDDFDSWVNEDPDRKFFCAIGNNQDVYLKYLEKLELSGFRKHLTQWMTLEEKGSFDRASAIIFNQILGEHNKEASNEPGV